MLSFTFTPLSVGGLLTEDPSVPVICVKIVGDTTGTGEPGGRVSQGFWGTREHWQNIEGNKGNIGKISKGTRVTLAKYRREQGNIGKISKGTREHWQNIEGNKGTLAKYRREQGNIGKISKGTREHWQNIEGNKGTLAKYRREQGYISQFLGTGEQNSKNYSTKTFGKCVGTWEHRAILEGNKGTRTLGRPSGGPIIGFSLITPQLKSLVIGPSPPPTWKNVPPTLYQVSIGLEKGSFRACYLLSGKFFLLDNYVALR